MANCRPPKSQSVTSYFRAPPRKKRKVAKGTKYFVAENASGHTCGHHHRTRGAAAKCAAGHNKHARRRYGGRAATYVTEAKTA